MNSQNARVLAALKAHSITPIDAMHMGVFRLAARVCDLRAAGYQIETRMESHGGGKHARYFLRSQSSLADADMGKSS